MTRDTLALGIGIFSPVSGAEKAVHSGDTETAKVLLHQSQSETGFLSWPFNTARRTARIEKLKMVLGK